MSVAEGVAKAPVIGRKPGGFLLLVFLPGLILAIGLVALVLAQFLPERGSPTYGIDQTTTAGIPAAVAAPAVDPIVLLDR
ncbi:MAG: hypothetical protein KIT43_03155 [Bauldia sp.]|nr:hypothetical protein [Bauldia sp.]MCW5718952.1 hypothetical protein [Bauldia sp.]